MNSAAIQEKMKTKSMVSFHLPHGRELLIKYFSIILKLYSPRYPLNITFSRRGRPAKSYFSCVVYRVLARYFYTIWCSRLKIILKQLFALGSVNIGKYLPRLRLGKYSPIFTSPSANNC